MLVFLSKCVGDVRTFKHRHNRLFSPQGSPFGTMTLPYHKFWAIRWERKRDLNPHPVLRSILNLQESYTALHITLVYPFIITYFRIEQSQALHNTTQAMNIWKHADWRCTVRKYVATESVVGLPCSALPNATKQSKQKSDAYSFSANIFTCFSVIKVASTTIPVPAAAHNSKQKVSFFWGPCALLELAWITFIMK